jgi:hypothetical protein
MKTIFLSINGILFLAFFMLSSNLTLLGNQDSPFKGLNRDTTSPDSTILRISQADFNEKMDYYIDMMKEEEDFVEADYIEMVLIDNTYFVFMQEGNTNYRVQAHNEFLDFLKNYMEDIRKTLEATEQGCNGGFYSKKHNLCVGGTSPNEKSIYDVYAE